MPTTENLGLDKAGVALNAKGAVIVDAQLRTTQPHIYAMGDVTDRVNLTPVATAEGHALADTLFGNNPRSVSLGNVPSAVFSTPPIATVGLTEEQAARAWAGRCLRDEVHADAAQAVRPRPQVDDEAGGGQATQKVLGVHMLGEDAPEIMQGLAIAVVMGATKADFDRTIGIHPTAAEEFVTLRTRTRTTDLAKAAE